ncbi:MAG: DUF2723 domain-containing protein [Myxococcales bacterium]|nr:DUF2723 domain-containing protein [Myxococcales bacterium]
MHAKTAKWEIVAVGVLAALSYLATTSPSVYVVDSNEFVVTAALLGNPHPPGHPLYTVLAHIVSLVPMGSLAFRINLFSGMAGVAALAFFAALARRLLLALAPSMSTTLRSIAVVSISLPLIFAKALWFQAVRAEVYALHLFVVVAALQHVVWYLEGGPLSGDGVGESAAHDTRWLYALGLLAGLGLGNHHFLLVLALPGLLLALLLHPEGRHVLLGRRLLWVLLFGLLGLSVYALVPLRSAAGAVVDWGDSRTLSRFVDVITARMFQRSIGETTGVDVLDNLGRIALFTLGELGPWVTVLALFGLVVGLLRWPRLASALLLLWIGNILSKALMVYDPTNPDAAGYLVFGLVIAGLSALFALAHLHERSRRPHVRTVVVALFALGIGAGLSFTVAPAFERCNLRRFRGAETLTLTLFERLPRDAIVLSSYYTITFNHWYFGFVERRRPDIELSHQSFALGTPDGRETIRRLCRFGLDLCAVARAYHRRRAFPGDLVAALAKKRPAFIENQAEWILAAPRLLPFAYLLAVDRPPPATPFWSLVRRRMRRGDWSLEVRRLCFWFHVLAAAGWLRHLDADAALRAVVRAETIPGFEGVQRVEQLHWLRREIAHVRGLRERTFASTLALRKAQHDCAQRKLGPSCLSAPRDRLSRALRAEATARRLYQSFDWGAFVSRR